MNIVEKRSTNVAHVLQYMVDTKRIIGSAKIVVDNPYEYWITCAINELFTEVGSHFSWEVWKKEALPNYPYARLEAIDVIMHVLSAISTLGVGDTQPLFRLPLVLFYTTEFVNECDLYNNKRDWFAKCGNDIVSLLMNFPKTSYDECDFCSLIGKLCELTYMDDETFELYAMTKCCFLRQRIRHGFYVPRWNKTSVTGETEDMVLTELIEKHLSNPGSTMKEHLERVAQCANLFIR